MLPGLLHWVGDADVVDAHHAAFEHCADLVDVLKGEGAVVELVVGHLVVDNAVDHSVNALLVVSLEASAGGFYRVDNHHNGGFSRIGSGTQITIVGDVDFFVGMMKLCLSVEIAGNGGAVMGAYEVDHLGREVELLGKADAITHMLHNDAGTLLVIEVVVRSELPPISAMMSSAMLATCMECWKVPGAFCESSRKAGVLVLEISIRVRLVVMPNIRSKMNMSG